MKIMIIPGNGSPDMNSEIWYPYIKKELEIIKSNIKIFEIIIKNMPDPDLARKDYWLPFIEQQLKGDENAILIGHSSGAVAILRYLEKHKVQGAILIGACYTDLGDVKEKASGYFDGEWNWSKIKQNAKWIIQFASTNDPYIPIEEARHVRDKLHTEYYEYDDQGHFSSDVTFPELVEVLKRKLKY